MTMPHARGLFQIAGTSEPRDLGAAAPEQYHATIITLFWNFCSWHTFSVHGVAQVRQLIGGSSAVSALTPDR